MKISNSDLLEYFNFQLYFDNKKLAAIAKEYKTPLYIYSENQILNQLNKFKSAANKNNIDENLICFALKANPNIELLQLLFKNGAGADIVSGGELKQALDCGCDPMKIVFSGVGKTAAEIEMALNASENGIYSFNAESIEEIKLINELAAKNNKIARVAIRVNPKVNAKTHRHISTGYKTHKFGILKKDILAFLKKDLKALKRIKLVGFSVHIGSQLTKFSATKDAIKEVCEIANKTKAPLEFIDVGGGLGVDYKKKHKKDFIDKYMKTVNKALKSYKGNRPKIVFEPGRYISASAGIFLTKVIRTKESGKCFFAIVDGGMNDFVRTSLYEAYHKIVPIDQSTKKKIKTEIVGPICETADSFASNYKIQKLKADDLIAVLDVGAYGHSMSSTYNLRNRPNELIIKTDDSVKLFKY